MARDRRGDARCDRCGRLDPSRGYTLAALFAETSRAERTVELAGLIALALVVALVLPAVARLSARALARTTGALIVALGIGAIAPLLRSAPAGPNLLLISIDTLRADHLGAYGYAQARTPNIDALASSGTLFETVVSAPVTLPAMATLMTGLDPAGHGAHYNGFYRVAAAPVTLAEWLSERGYRTGAAVGNFALDASFGIAQGFTSFDDKMTATMEPDAKRAVDPTRAGGRASSPTNPSSGSPRTSPMPASVGSSGTRALRSLCGCTTSTRTSPIARRARTPRVARPTTARSARSPTRRRSRRMTPRESACARSATSSEPTARKRRETCSSSQFARRTGPKRAT
jgi:hypothetical protein